MIRKIVYILIDIFSYIMPKNDKLLVFNSVPDYSDNSYALYKYCKKNLHNYRLVWLAKRPEEILKKNDNLEIYSRISLKGIWYYTRAKYVFFTHGIYDNKIFIKNKICLWHGMPLKRIGYLSETETSLPPKMEKAISTSEYFQNIMSKAFNLDKTEVLITGQPRNDLLFEETKFYFKNKIDKKNYNKIFIWMPTFRKAIVNWQSNGIVQKDYISILPFDKLEELNNLLEKKFFLLIIKLHPFDILQNEQFRDFSNIIVLKNEDLVKIDEQLYPLLGSTDALITDYSSVWIDYEILNKPIFFAIHDYEEYRNSRGLLFEDFPNISPYPVIKSYNELVEFIVKYEKIDLNKKEITDKYNKYKDNKSCERIVKYLGINKN